MIKEKASCLLIIDVQHGFINQSTKHIPLLVEREQEHYEYIIVTQFVNPEGSFYRKLMKWNRFAPDSADIKLAFMPKKGALIIEKHIYSCINDKVMKWIRDRGINTIYLCGLDTDFCVAKCAVDLFENGIEPVVIERLCASHSGIQYHNYAIKALKRFIGLEQIR